MAPVAIAGFNQTVELCHGETIEVILDGSASYDNDGNELSYYWSWIIDSNVYALQKGRQKVVRSVVLKGILQKLCV